MQHFRTCARDDAFQRTPKMRFSRGVLADGVISLTDGRRPRHHTPFTATTAAVSARF